MAWEKDLERWVDVRLIDPLTASRIRDFENSSDKKRLRWPAILAITFGALMLCAGILLFVAAHWDDLAPSQRFMLVLMLVGVFHIAAGILGEKMPSMGIALHVAGTALWARAFTWPGKSSIWRSIGLEGCYCGRWGPR